MVEPPTQDVIAARLLLSPRFVNWISHTLQLKPTDWNGLGASLGRLSSMRLLEPALADDLQELTLTARFALARRESADVNGHQGRRAGP